MGPNSIWPICIRERDTEDAKTQREGHVKTWQEDSQMQAKERGFKRNKSSQHLNLGLLASKI